MKKVEILQLLDDKDRRIKDLAKDLTELQWKFQRFRAEIKAVLVKNP